MDITHRSGSWRVQVDFRVRVRRLAAPAQVFSLHPTACVHLSRRPFTRNCTLEVQSGISLRLEAQRTWALSIQNFWTLITTSLEV